MSISPLCRLCSLGVVGWILLSSAACSDLNDRFNSPKCCKASRGPDLCTEVRHSPKPTEIIELPSKPREVTSATPSHLPDPGLKRIKVPAAKLLIEVPSPKVIVRTMPQGQGSEYRVSWITSESEDKAKVEVQPAQPEKTPVPPVLSKPVPEKTPPVIKSKPSTPEVSPVPGGPRPLKMPQAGPSPSLPVEEPTAPEPPALKEPATPKPPAPPTHVKPLSLPPTIDPVEKPPVPNPVKASPEPEVLQRVEQALKDIRMEVSNLEQRVGILVELVTEHDKALRRHENKLKGKTEK